VRALIENVPHIINHSKVVNLVVFLGDNTTYKIHGQGMIIVRLLDGIEKQTPKVLHVLILKKKLFSTKQYDKVGGEMRIKQGQYTLINKSRDIITKCKLNDDLYEFGETIKNESKFIAIPTTTQINMANLWHLKLGHYILYTLH
jgi:hypothetical protein